MLAGPLHHGLDAEVVNIKGSEANINGGIDSVVGGLSGCCPISLLTVRLDKRWGAGEREREKTELGEEATRDRKGCKVAMLRLDIRSESSAMQKK